MEQAYDWIRGTVVIVLVFTVAEHLLPSPQYRKYMKLYGGLLLVFVTVNFCASLAGCREWLKDKVEQAYREAEEQEQASLKERSEEDNSLLLDAYRKTISDHVAEQLDGRGWQTVEVELELTEEGLQGMRVAAIPPAGQKTAYREAAAEECRRLAQIYGLEESRVVIRMVQ